MKTWGKTIEKPRITQKNEVRGIKTKIKRGNLKINAFHEDSCLLLFLF